MIAHLGRLRVVMPCALPRRSNRVTAGYYCGDDCGGFYLVATRDRNHRQLEYRSVGTWYSSVKLARHDPALQCAFRVFRVHIQ